MIAYRWLWRANHDGPAPVRAGLPGPSQGRTSRSARTGDAGPVDSRASRDRINALPGQPGTLTGCWAVVIAACGLLAGSGAAWYYHRAGLTLSHYDARAHLVVARRVIDSLTPGWQQLGAVWLPLPHLLNLVPVQVDLFYRTGASAVAISVLAFTLALYALARAVLGATRSPLAAVTGASLLLVNPDVLYLQATPMTEPLLLGLSLLGMTLTFEWLGREGRRGQAAQVGREGQEAQEGREGPEERVGRVGQEGIARARRRAGWVLAAACLTRYEAWLVTCAILAASAFALWRRGREPRAAVAAALRLAVYPAVAIVAFLVQGRLATGVWFVTSGFFVPDNPDAGHPLSSAVSVWWGLHELAGYGLTIAGTIGLAAACGAVARGRSARPVVVLLAPVAAGALPWYAFLEGHPFRIRYMVPLIPALGIGIGLGLGLLPRRMRLAAAFVVVGLLVAEVRPIDPRAAMVVEAQLDVPNSHGRRAVTAVLAREYRGEVIMASMGSLAHYMQELSAEGFALRDFLHEGNGDIWEAALANPRPHVGWILTEEVAEGGGMLAGLARARPSFLDGYERVAEGGGVALYRRRSNERSATSNEQ